MKYIGRSGTEHSISSIPDFAKALSSEALNGDTLVFDESANKWVCAKDAEDYRFFFRDIVSATDSKYGPIKWLKIVGWLLLIGGAAVWWLTVSLQKSPPAFCSTTAAPIASKAERVHAPTSPPIPQNADEKKRQALLIQSLKPLIQREQSLITRFQDDLNTLKAEDVLLAKRMVDKEGIGQSLKILVRYEKMLAQFDEDRNHYKKQVEKELAALSFNDAERAQFLSVFNAGATESNVLYREWRNTEQAMVIKLHDMLNFVSDRIGTMALSEDSSYLVFQNDQDVNGFKKLMADLVALAKQELHTRQNAIEAVQKHRKELEALEK